MKIHKLILKNINSLKGENSIDFKANFDNSLFLITGDTGAGKSTILDAICCVLYNQTPRLKDARAVLTKHTAEANITLEYEVKNIKYRNSWSIQRAYKKVSGELAKAPKMEIAKFDEESGEFEIIETKISLIPKMVQEITGLDFSQFQKSMLLSQGNFDAFLKASVNERADLLEKMTGTGIYAQIGIKTFEVYKAKKKEIDDIKLKVGEISVLDSDELKGYEKESKELKKESEKLSKEQKDNEKTLQEIDKKETLLVDIEKFSKVVLDSKTRYKELEDEKKTISKELDNGRKINEEFIKEYKQELKIIDDVVVLDLKLSAGEKNEQIISKTISQLIKKDEEIEVSEKIKLENIKKLKEQNEDSTNYLKKNSVDEPLLNDFKVLSLRIDNYLKLKTLQDKDSKTKSGLEKEIEESTRKLNGKTKELEIYKEKSEYLKSKTIVLRYEEDRVELKDDEACPLCGSFSHPYKEDSGLSNIESDILIEQSKLSIDIKECEKTLSLLEPILIKNRTKVESIDENLKAREVELEQVLLDLDSYFKTYHFSVEDDLVKIKNDLETRFELYVRHKIKLDDFVKELVSLENNLEIIKNQKLTNSQQNKDESKRLELTQGENQKLSIDRAKLYGSKDTKKEKKELEIKRDTLDKKLQNQKSKNQKNQTELESTKEKVSEFTQMLSDKTKVLESLDEKYDLLDKEKLLKTSDELKEKLEILNRNYGEITQKLKENKLKQESSKKYFDEIESKQKQIKPYEILNDFIGNADGKKFKKFAQNLTLGHLLSLANKHLKTLNERYFLVKDKAKDLEILVVDTYLGDTKRSVNSLSGGEGFLVSLALALGLSDMVSSKVSIDSLFLDEGFGTLDSKTLNDALSTLSKLQDSGKMIGIISHVEALKNTIGLQVEVKKTSGGVGSISIKI
ncbi:MAG: AAA family ATPase [Campylobacterota bacterium]|nr:AAA family ATPase [Campylobacterota bacterium]